MADMNPLLFNQLQLCQINKVLIKDSSQFMKSMKNINVILVVLIGLIGAFSILPLCVTRAQDAHENNLAVDSLKQRTLDINPDSIKAPVVNDTTTKSVVETLEEFNFNEDEQSLDKAIARNEELLEKYPDDVFAPNVMFQLSELYIRKSRLKYRKAMIEYEKNYRLFEIGNRSVEPILPRITFKEAIDYCYKILDKFPKIKFKEHLLYRLGICHLDEGNLEKTKEFFNKLIFETPESQYSSEAHFRLGEYYFNKRDFHKAIEYYQHLKGQWDNAYFNMALYKLGWSYYNIEDYVNAIATFVYLLSDIGLLEEANTKVLGKTKADLRKEAIDYIAICFSEYGGPEMARTFLKKRGSEDYNLHIFLKLGEVYKKRNFYYETIRTYEILLELYPFYQYAAKIRQYIIEAYEKDYNTEKAMESRVKLVEDYGPGSKWINQYPEGMIRNNAIKEADKALFQYASYYHQKAQEKQRKREYLIAAEKYQDYLKKFPHSENASRVNYYLAECFYEVENYVAAAEEYTKVITQYGPTKFQEDASYNRILSYYNILQKNPSSDSLTFYLEDFLGDQQTLPEPIRVSQKVQKDLLQACNDFIIMLPNSERIQEVMMKFGEELYNLGQYDLAAKVYEKLTNEHKDSPYYAHAYSMIAQSYFQKGDYEKATAISTQIQQLFPDSTDLIKNARKLVAFSGFKSAERYQSNNDIQQAADKFALVASNSTDPEVAKTAAFRAADQYDSLGMGSKAVRVLESLPEKQPHFKFADEVLYKAAYLREKAEQWQLAIIDYMKIVDNHPNSKLASKALFNVGLCYENMEKWELARGTFKRYTLTQFTEKDNDELIEAMYKIGEMYNKEGKLTHAATAWNNTVKKYIELKKKLEAADSYIPAKAQFMVGEIKNKEFENIKIGKPYEKALIKIKTGFNQVLQAYTAAAKFRVAEWSTCALYKLGQLHENMAGILLQFPVDNNLTEAQIQEYQLKLTTPFKQKAYNLYKQNVNTAKKSNIENDWVQESQKRMEALIIELGLGTGAKLGESISKNVNVSNSN